MKGCRVLAVKRSSPLSRVSPLPQHEFGELELALARPGDHLVAHWHVGQDGRPSDVPKSSPRMTGPHRTAAGKADGIVTEGHPERRVIVLCVPRASEAEAKPLAHLSFVWHSPKRVEEFFRVLEVRLGVGLITFSDTKLQICDVHTGPVAPNPDTRDAQGH